MRINLAAYLINSSFLSLDNESSKACLMVSYKFAAFRSKSFSRLSFQNKQATVQIAREPFWAAHSLLSEPESRPAQAAPRSSITTFFWTWVSRSRMKNKTTHVMAPYAPGSVKRKVAVGLPRRVALQSNSVIDGYAASYLLNV